MHFRPPEPGDAFAVRGRGDELTVSKMIASFADEHSIRTLSNMPHAEKRLR